MKNAVLIILILVGLSCAEDSFLAELEGVMMGTLQPPAPLPINLSNITANESINTTFPTFTQGYSSLSGYADPGLTFRIIRNRPMYYPSNVAPDGSVGLPFV